MLKDPYRTVELAVSADKVCFIIVKAREWDAKVPPVEPDPGSNASDDGEREILEDYPDDATLEELRRAIEALNEDEIIEVIALAWIGRGDYDIADIAEARRLAAERHRGRSARYLLGIPNLGDCLDEALAASGHS